MEKVDYISQLSHIMKLTKKEEKVLREFFEKKISLTKAKKELGYGAYQTVYIRTIHLLRLTK